MRVPNTGLDPELRRIVSDGYRLAERLMRNYRDPEPGLMTALLTAGQQAILGFYRAVLRS